MLNTECSNKSSDSTAPALLGSDSLPSTDGPLSTTANSVSPALPINIIRSNSPVPSFSLNPDPPLAQHLGSSLVQNSRSSPSAYRQNSVFKSLRYSANARTENSQLPILPIERPIKNNEQLVSSRLAYLHTGRCTETPPIQGNPSTYLCHFPDIHIFKDLTNPDGPIIRFIKYNRVTNICGLFNNESEPPSKEKNNLVKFIHSMGVNHCKTNWVRGDEVLNTFEKRRRTFNKCYVIPLEDVHSLCEAGFYYIGNGFTKETKCFCCGKCVLCWGTPIKPWTTHATISKDCRYMVLSKGKYYVDKVYTNYQHILNYFETNYFDELVNIGHAEDSFNEISTTPNYSEREDQSLVRLKSYMKITGQPLSERLNSTATIKNKTEEVLLCKICFKEIMNVLIIPCGHIATCIPCSLTLRRCPLCIQPFNCNTYFLRVFIVITDDIKRKENEHLKTIGNFIKKSKIKPTLCKICQKNGMVAYVPCRHLYSCAECTLTLNNSCPICNIKLMGMIQTSLTSY